MNNFILWRSQPGPRLYGCDVPVCEIEGGTRDVMQVVDETMTTRPAPSYLKALSDDELWQLYETHAWSPRDRQLDELDEAILAEIDRRAELPRQPHPAKR